MTLEQLAILNEQAESIRKLRWLYDRWMKNEPPRDDGGLTDVECFQMREDNWKRIPHEIKGRFICDAADWMLKEIAREEAVFESITVKAEPC